MEVALLVFMRRFALRIDQLPAWAFVALAMLGFALARATRLLSLVRSNHGGMELGGILSLAMFVALVIFAVRRRHVSVLHSAGHVLLAVVAGNAVALAAIWPFVPGSYSLSLAPVLRDTVVAGGSMALATLPLAAGMLWLSRRYGSHSALTERRLRLVHSLWRERVARAQDADAG